MNLSEACTTNRMYFRLLKSEDTDVVYRQFSDPDMCRYFSEPPCSYEEAQDIIQHYSAPEGKGHHRYGMFDRETDAFIGTCGYHYWDLELKQVEIGYDIWKEYWRQGYMSEALPVLINICLEHLGADCIYILTHPQNAASMASVRRFGFEECEPCRNVDEQPQVCMKLIRS
ncbi:GNAT family N-acetyltransferase [Paenibacillus tritici]|uniref:GNAT family N-acetyltransferase n=1 Tax=Paenibacillus tritici TaxID=1873425 RepID=A0ABX2DR67_9BACL|nr:GNAT family N-acetyltransferase [Paenibacillus tritici]NQX46079.1 GNAT family N-acetyltransferase [Paenibacillus tritici]QUL52712.1 GNAT family N-acetyltransferase [Paenibacillus tritici]